MFFSGLGTRHRANIALAFSSFLAVSLLAGCGGGNDGGSNNQTTALANVSINWPERSRDVDAPTSALSARITFDGARTDGTDETFVVNRTGGASAYSATYRTPDFVVTGNRTLFVDFYAEADAEGDFVGTASGTASIQTDGTGVPQIRVQSGGVASVSVDPMVVGIGERRRVVISARDNENQLITVSPGSQFVSITGGSDRGRIVQGVFWLLTGLDQGTVRVRAVVDGISGEADMSVTTGRSSARPAPLAQAATLQDELRLLNQEERITNSAVLGADDSWVVLYDSGNVAFQNAPPELVNAFDVIREGDFIATTAALGDYGSWAVVYGRNGYNYRNIPDNMASRLALLNTNQNVVSVIALGPNDSWVVIHDQTQYAAENIPSALRDKLEASRAGSAAAITSLALGSNDSFVLGYDGRGDFFSNIPFAMETDLQEIYDGGFTITSVALGLNGSYGVTYAENGFEANATRSKAIGQAVRKASNQNKGQAEPKGK